MNYLELQLVDDSKLMVQNALASALREFEGVDARYIDLDKVKANLEAALPGTTFTVSVEYDELNIKLSQ